MSKLKSIANAMVSRYQRPHAGRFVRNQQNALSIFSLNSYYLTFLQKEIGKGRLSLARSAVSAGETIAERVAEQIAERVVKRIAARRPTTNRCPRGKRSPHSRDLPYAGLKESS